MAVESPEAVDPVAPLFRLVEVEGGVPVKVWAHEIEEGAMEQAVNLARLPFAVRHVGLMPDAHQGYGMPIGGVLAADAAIVPNAIGVDIGCGVAMLKTNLYTDDLGGEPWDSPPTDRLQDLLEQIARRVPVGNGPRGEHATPRDVPVDLGTASTTAYGVITGAGQRERAPFQLGTLGGGNHFIEVQADEKDRLYVMLHSGSRSVGKKICDHWVKIALKLNQMWYSNLPDNDLAYLPWGADEALGYYEDMRVALRWAEENRKAMLVQVDEAVSEVLSGTTELVADVHHNYAAFESHFGRNVIVHRKGAVRAQKGEVVLIPGSMGTSSYVGVGLGNRESFNTCQHGAGRRLGRKATERSHTQEEFIALLGTVKLGGNAVNARDESPFAYKDIEEVMAASADLVRPVTKLRPLGVVKG